MTQVVHYKKSVGQIPGETYNAIVTDESGKAISIGWFFMDKDGKQITSDLFSDTGIFHFTIPDYNWQDIFVQIYSTEDYEPVVKTFDELVTNPRITLKKKGTGNGLSTEAMLSLAGLAIAVVSMNNSKRVGATNYVQRIKSQPTGTKLLIVGGVAFGLYFLLKYKPTKEQQDYLKTAQSRLDYLAQHYGIVPSMTIAQFQSIRSELVTSFAKCGTEEYVVYHSFELLNNEADLYQLIITYGIAKYDGCFEGSLPNWTVHFVLSQSIVAELNAGEIDTVNKILKDKNINFSF